MKLLVIIILNLFFISNNSLIPPPITIEFTHIKNPKGTIRIGIFAENGTFGGSYAKPNYGLMLAVASTNTLRTSMQLPAGKYAMAIYHDINNNVVLDRNIVGYPKEPFAFSNNYRPIISGPKFSDCVFEVKEDVPLLLKIKLLN